MDLLGLVGQEVMRHAHRDGVAYVIRARPAHKRKMNGPKDRWVVRARALWEDPFGVPVAQRDVQGRRAAIVAAEELAQAINRGDELGPGHRAAEPDRGV